MTERRHFDRIHKSNSFLIIESHRPMAGRYVKKVHKVQIIVLLPHWVKLLKLERSFRFFCSFAQINPDLLYLDVNNFLITQWTFSLNVAHFLYQWFEKTVVTNYTFLLSIFMGIFLDVKRQGLDHYVSKTTCRPWFF